MSKKRRVIEVEGVSAPAYLVTFAALVTLLMLFFVLLLTVASTQDEGILGKGRYAETQEAFLRSIKTFGLGGRYSKKQGPDFGHIKPKYFIVEPNSEFEGRTIDAKEEKVRQLFQEVSRSVKTTSSQIVAKKANFSVTNISFSPGEARLNEPAKKFLTRFAGDLQQDVGSKDIKLYVLGLTNDEQTEKKQWILSARRAQVVADFLNDILPSELQWPVYSWGAGPGGYWVAQDSLISKQSQILIAVLRAND